MKNVLREGDLLVVRDCVDRTYLCMPDVRNNEFCVLEPRDVLLVTDTDCNVYHDIKFMHPIHGFLQEPCLTSLMKDCFHYFNVIQGAISHEK